MEGLQQQIAELQQHIASQVHLHCLPGLPARPPVLPACLPASMCSLICPLPPSSARYSQQQLLILGACPACRSTMSSLQLRNGRLAQASPAQQLPTAAAFCWAEPCCGPAPCPHSCSCRVLCPPCCVIPLAPLQVAAVDAANAERDAYKLSAQEIQERSKVGASLHRLTARGQTHAPKWLGWPPIPPGWKWPRDMHSGSAATSASGSLPNSKPGGASMH